MIFLQNRMINYFKNRKKNALNIKTNKKYLYKGVYFYICNANRNYWKKYNFIGNWITDVLFSRENQLKYKIKSILGFDLRIIRNDGTNAVGNQLYITRKGKIKVFDKEKKQVVTICDEREAKIASLFQSNYIKFFPSSPFIEIDNENSMIVERFLQEQYQWRKNYESVKETMIDVMNSLSLYVASEMKNAKIKYVNDFISAIISKTNDQDLLNFIYEIKTSIGNKDRLFFIPQHNDLVLSNVIRDLKGITVLDYEFYNENIFYYDSMTWIIWEAVRYNHDSYLNDYLNGEYDNLFIALFNSSAMKFTPGKRALYAIYYILANINVHLDTSDNTNIASYNRIFQILKQKIK